MSTAKENFPASDSCTTFQVRRSGLGAAAASDPVAASRPRLGQVAAADLTQTPSPFVGIAVGFSDTAMGALPLPAPLATVGMPGCTLLQSSDLLGLAAAPLTATSFRYSLAIPNQPALLGLWIYLQGHAFAPGTNALGVVVSNGIAWHVGNQ